MAENEYLNQRPQGHHDFVNASVKGQQAIKECRKCGKESGEHDVYERVRVIGFHGEYMAWSKK